MSGFGSVQYQFPPPGLMILLWPRTVAEFDRIVVIILDLFHQTRTVGFLIIPVLI